MSRDTPTRVLHVFAAMDRGGAETRTLEIMRRLPSERYHFDFCVLSGRRGAYAAEIARLGGHVVPCPLAGPATFMPRLVGLLRRGHYDVVHSHVHNFSGVILLLARLAGVPRRIAHIRSAHDGRASTPARRAYRMAMRQLIDANASAVIGVSECAMEAFWGAGWRHDRRKVVVYNGIEEARFRDAEGAATVRPEFRIPAGDALLLHVGGFSPPKNHAGLVDIFARLVARRARTALLLVGDGALRERVQEDVARRGLAAHVRFAGARDDIGRLLGAADVFVFPSLWEGLPGALLEALAAGVPVVASSIPPVLEIARRAHGIVAVDPADTEGFARRIDELLSAPAGAREGGGRTRLPDMFTIERSMVRLLACYA
jgi:glycosyltransferase involved in cell wall biosynthesis